MEMYITPDNVGAFSEALRSLGMEVFVEGYTLQVLLSDGSYRKVTIIDLPKPSELLGYMVEEQRKTLFT
jgi:hypothetical protein